MTDREKVIKGLEQIINDPFMKARADYWVMVCADALALLKEQEAVKPFIQISEHTGRKWLTCGACEYTIESEKESWEEINFCPKCGRPVLWEGR